MSKEHTNFIQTKYSKFRIHLIATLLCVCNFNYGYTVAYTSTFKIALTYSKILDQKYISYFEVT